jgi:serine protease AprX
LNQSRLSFSIVFTIALASSAFAGAPNPKLESDLAFRAATESTNHTRVIVSLASGQSLPASFQPYATTDRLDSVDAQVLDVPDALLASLSASPAVTFVRGDRPVFEQDFRTDISAGSFFANQNLGFSGKGITVAVLDSGIDATHDDLRRRVVGFIDFVNFRRDPYDDNGHGTHVAGIIAGDGFDSRGKQAGVAPEAQIVALKVLDANGQGRVSDVVAAFDWIGKFGAAYGIRIVNVSLAASIKESYDTDPLAQAAKRLVEKGIIVVAAAGNRGKQDGHEVFGGVGAPGNAPWVFTVGASSSMGSLTRGDDTVADFSSRGPTRIDFAAKPDIVAGGVGIISASAPGSTDYTTKPQFLLPGAFPQASLAYEVMTGTSMAAPAVSGTLALMLEANPALTPNLAKAIVEYTAQWNGSYSALEQGAGFLNALGAVRLADFYAHAQQGDVLPVESIWSRHINWGNHRIAGGVLVPGANAWATTTTWGVSKLAADDGNIIWGTDDDGNIIWGTAADDSGNIIWGTDDENIIWGTSDDAGNIIWGTDDDDSNIIWGTDDVENILWGTAADATDLPADPSYDWFLDRKHDAIWIANEFGDPVLARGKSR